jgi:hypothetical protein
VLRNGNKIIDQDRENVEIEEVEKAIVGGEGDADLEHLLL